MGDARYVDTVIRWNPEMVNRLHLDMDDINLQFKKAFSLEDHTEWI